MAKHGSHSVSFGVSFLKGASEEGWGGGGGNENKNKFKKLKANRSQSKDRKFGPKCRQKNLLGVFAIMTWATTMPVLVTSGNFKAISSSSLSFGGGMGARGGGGVSDPKCNQ